MPKLTIKQEKFVLKYLECGNASEAYRFAYNCSKMSDNAIWNAASILMDDPKVTQRIDYLKNNLAEAAGISALQIIREHQKIAFSNFSRLRNGWMELKDFQELSDEEKACIQSVETKKRQGILKRGNPSKKSGSRFVFTISRSRWTASRKCLDTIKNLRLHKI